MAGAKDFNFKEKLTPYISEQMELVKEKYGTKSKEYLAWELQYIKNESEGIVNPTDRMRHYESEMHIMFEGKELKGVERLYERTILVEPSSVCAAHCRWCLRGQYPLFTLRDEDIVNFAKYCGSEIVKDELREILITGGDPFMVPKKLGFIIEQIKLFAPNIQFIRIGTRVPVQDPSKVNADLIEVLKSASPIKVEVATHINHPVELTKEAIKAYSELYNTVFKIYDQTVLLKGVNDDFGTLSKLYDMFRYIGIEAHYLFHCIPMRGMSHHRTSIQKGLDLIMRLTSSGNFSGRAKPLFTLMTDLGKISLYHGSVLEKNDANEVLIQSKYRVEDFTRRNNSWTLPSSALEDENGFLRVWYPDGADE